MTSISPPFGQFCPHDQLLRVSTSAYAKCIPKLYFDVYSQRGPNGTAERNMYCIHDPHGTEVILMFGGDPNRVSPFAIVQSH
jgi:hypothetical protein